MRRFGAAACAAVLAATVLALVPSAATGASASSAGVPGVPGAISGTWGTGANSSKLTVKWTSPGGSYLEYDVRYRVDSGTVFDPSPNYPWPGWATPPGGMASTASKELSGLTSTSTYVVAVRARDRATGRYGGWAISGLIEPAGTPARPGPIAESARSATSLTVGWPKVSSAAGGYEVRVALTAAPSSWATVLAVAQPSSGTQVSAMAPAANLPAGSGAASTYVVQVRSKSASGVCGTGSVKCSRWVTSVQLAQLDIEDLSLERVLAGSDPSYVELRPLDVVVTWDALPSAVNASYRVRLFDRVGDPGSYYDTSDDNSSPGAKPDNWNMDWQWYSLCNDSDASTNPPGSRGCTDPFKGTAPYLKPVWDFGTPAWGTTRTVAASACTNGTCTYTFPDSTVGGLATRVQVWAVDSSNKAGPRATHTTHPARPPAMPLWVKAVAPSGASVQAQWLQGYDRGSPIIGFDVTLYRYDPATRQYAVHTSVAGTKGTPLHDPNRDPRNHPVLTYTFHGVPTSSEYYVGVRAQNIEGYSDQRYLRKNLTLTPTKPPPPAPPSASGTGTSVTLTWEAPADDGGAAVTGYGVQYRAQNTDSTWPSNWTAHTRTGTGTSTTETVGSLTSGAAYQFQVSATNSVGTGAWSAAGLRGVAPAAPAAPTLTSGNASLAVAWTAPAAPDGGSAVSDYDLQYRSSTDGGTTWGTWTAFSHSGTARTATITGLTNGDLHEVQVRAGNATGAGGWSTAAQETPGRPGAPTGVTASASKGGVSVAWTAPADNGGSAVTAAQVRTRVKNPQGDWTAAVDSVDDPATSPARIIGLTVGTEVDVQLRVVNAIGHSSWVDAGSATPLATTAPTGKAQNVIVTYADSKFWVRFNHTGDDGGLPLQFQMSGTVHTQNTNRANSGLNYTAGTAAQRRHNGTDYDFVYWFDEYQNPCCDLGAWVSICTHTGTQVSKVNILVKNTVGNSGWHGENLSPRVDSGCD